MNVGFRPRFRLASKAQGSSPDYVVCLSRKKIWEYFCNLQWMGSYYTGIWQFFLGREQARVFVLVDRPCNLSGLRLHTTLCLPPNQWPTRCIRISCLARIWKTERTYTFVKDFRTLRWIVIQLGVCPYKEKGDC